MHCHDVSPHTPAGRKPRLRLRIATLAAAIVLAVLPSVGKAAESAAQTSPRATVTLISDHDGVSPGQSFRIGLRQKLAPHWHTYWKNPGDAGAPPEIAFDLPEGASASEIAWPGPDGIPVGPVRNFGYENEIVLPVTITVPQSAAPGGIFAVAAKADWLVCEKECIPESGSFSLDLPIAATPVAAGRDVAAAFAATDERLPVASRWTAGLTEEGPALALTVEGEGLSRASVQSAFFYPEEWGVITHAAEQRLDVEDGRLSLAMERGMTFSPQINVAGLLAVTDGGGQTRWFEVTPAVGSAAGASGPGVSGIGAVAGSMENLPLWQAAVFAFVGGLILNLMPCVFPVLAIKATSVARLSGGALRNATTAGGAEPFSSAKLAALREEGKPVFVNMTAAWCITCLVNERTTLSTATVREAFDRHDIAYLKGDWTNHDPEITAFLRSFNRDGLPFYAFYPGSGGEPVVLPPALTEATVVEEIRRTVMN